MPKAKKEELMVPDNSGFGYLSSLDLSDSNEDLAGLQVSFEKIKVPSGGGLFFELPSLAEDEPESVKEFTGVILYNHAIRAYYKSEYTGGHNPPDCGSMDGITGVGDPGGKCSDCKWSRWGTGKNGNGQACKERRRLYVLREGDAFPVLFTLPTASLDPWKYFARGLRNEHLSTKKVVTRFFLSKAVNKGGTDYSQAQFRMARLLSPDEATIIAVFSNEIRELAATVRFQDDVDSNGTGIIVDLAEDEPVPF